MKPFLIYSPKYDALTPEEKALLAEDVELVKKAVAGTDRLNDKKVFTRNAHARSFGYVRGKFIPLKNDTADMADFLHGSNLGVILRYSHPHFLVREGNGEYPAYGCSVKIYNKNVPVSAKFPLVNVPIFITNSVSKFLKIHIRANRFLIAKSKPYALSWFKLPAMAAAGLSIFADSQLFSILRNFLRVLDIEKQFVVTYPYYSIGAFRFGERMGKVRLQPEFKQKVVKEAGLDQKQLLKDYFAQNELTLNFQVQFATDEKRTPVNDLLKIWKEKHAPYVTLGKIILPKQDFQIIKIPTMKICLLILLKTVPNCGPSAECRRSGRQSTAPRWIHANG